jgi:hypothetical protein
MWEWIVYNTDNFESCIYLWLIYIWLNIDRGITHYANAFRFEKVILRGKERVKSFYLLCFATLLYGFARMNNELNDNDSIGFGSLVIKSMDSWFWLRSKSIRVRNLRRGPGRTIWNLKCQIENATRTWSLHCYPTDVISRTLLLVSSTLDFNPNSIKQL